MNHNTSMNQRRANAGDEAPTPPADTSFAVLPIDAIEPYRYNPRTGRNSRYHQIKESIRADGITNMLTVTRRDQHSKYTTYWGGNTRLMIAKELAAEGDARFATLQVMVKAWLGDAQVIVAQLAENDNRGDISFWDRAQGVQQFRAEFEKESGQTLSSVALHDELKRRGLNYGLRTLQNFVFSVTHLAPIGRWLAARSVNDVIRPAYVSLRRLAKKFDKDEQANEALDDVLQLHGIRLECDEQPAELDVQWLLNDWQTAAAKLLGTSAEQLQAMLAALRADADISAQALRELSAALPVQKASAAPNDDARPQAQKAQPKQQGLLAPTPSQPEPEAEQQPEKLRAEIKDLLARICQIAPLRDVLYDWNMPFGFLVDFPAEGDGWNKAGRVCILQPYLRAAMWHFLVAISGQLDERVRLPSEGVTFSDELAKDKAAFCAEFEKRGMPMNGAMPLMEMGGIAAIFAEPRLAGLVIKLLDAIEKLRLADPERAPDFLSAGLHDKAQQADGVREQRNRDTALTMSYAALALHGAATHDVAACLPLGEAEPETRAATPAEVTLHLARHHWFVQFHPALAAKLGSYKAALFLGHALYWTRHLAEKQPRGDGWFFMSAAQCQQTTGLTAREQGSVRRILRSLGLIEERLAGMPATLHYRVKVPALLRWAGIACKEPGRSAVAMKAIDTWLCESIRFYKPLADCAGSVAAGLYLSLLVQKQREWRGADGFT